MHFIGKKIISKDDALALKQIYIIEKFDLFEKRKAMEIEK